LRGEGGARSALGEGQQLVLTQRIEDCEQHTLAVRQHIVIPEAQDAVAFTRETRIPLGVSFAFRVLAAVDLDNELPLAAYKISDERADCFLTNEFESV
jgi:hypothetical protein